MSNIINDPFSTLARTGAPNPNEDLPVGVFPAVPRIEVIDLVGPAAANKQPAALEKQTNDLLTLINRIVAFCNILDTTFLRRDSSAQKDSHQGLTANLIASLFKIVSMHDGLMPTPSTTWAAGALSKSSSTISRVSGATFNTGMCGDLANGNGNYILWADQTVDQIVAFVDANTLTVSNVLSVLTGQPSTKAGSAAQLFLSSKDAVNADQLWQVQQLIKGVDLTPLLPRSGARPMYGDLDMGGGGGGPYGGNLDPGSASPHQIHNVAPATAGLDAINNNQLIAEATTRHADDVTETNARIAADYLLFDRGGDSPFGTRSGGNAIWGNMNMAGGGSPHAIYGLATAPGALRTGVYDSWAASKAYVDDAIRKFCPYSQLGQIQFVIKQDSTYGINPGDGLTVIPGLSVRLDNLTGPQAYANQRQSWWIIEAHIFYTFKVKTCVRFTPDSGSAYIVSTTLGQQINGAAGEGIGPRAYRMGITGMPGEQATGAILEASRHADDVRGAHVISGGADQLLSVVTGGSEGVPDIAPAGSHSAGYMDPLLGTNANFLSQSSVIQYRVAILVDGAGTLDFMAGSHILEGARIARIHVGSYIKAWQQNGQAAPDRY